MAGQGSARVTLREIDLSQVRNPQQSPQGVPAAVVGTARKGPAFVPRTFANMQQFNEVFGSMLEVGRDSNSNLPGPLALNEWMKSAQAGTFLRVLGVGDGTKAITGTTDASLGKVSEAGFIVGNKLVQARSGSNSAGKLGDNPHATMTNSAAAENLGKTHFLGCFMKDVEDSRFLCDSGVQAETSPASTNKVVVSNDVANGDTFQIFVPKEVINDVSTSKVSEDVTLTIKVVTNIDSANLGGAVFTDVGGRQTANIADNTIIVNDNATGSTVAENIKVALNVDITSGDSSHDYDDVDADGNDVARFNKLSFNPSEVFTVARAGSILTITLDSMRKEGNEAFIVETVGTPNNLISGTSGALNEKVYFAGAHLAAPVIRGVLMVPQGVKPSLDTNTNNALSGVFSDNATEVNIRKEAHGKTFGQDANSDGTDLAGYLVGKVGSSDQSFELLLNGFSNSDHPVKVKCSFDPDSDSYFAKVLNTDPTKIEEKGHYLYAHWDIDKNVAIPASDGLLHAGSLLSSGSYANMIGFVMAGAGNGSSATAGPDYDSFEQRFQTAKTPWIVSQFTSVSSNTAARPATAAAGGAKKLFRLYSLDDGEAGNTQFRLLISDLRYNGANDYGTFTLSLEKFDSDPVRGETLISWKKADLNPDSPNFIGRLIGDEHTYYDFDLDSDKQRLKTKGSYALKNNYVRIELSDEVKQGLIPIDSLPAGFQGHSHLRTTGITNNFVEQSGLGANSVFTDVSGTPLTTLNSAQALPLDYVKSISRLIATSTEEADSDLAWGVKLSVRENKDSDKKELVEQVFNHSVKSWTKFFPELGQSHAFETDGDEADKFQNSFFSLENIDLGESDSWNGSKYVRKPAAASNRFVTISQDAKGGNVKYLKFRCLFQGGFDGVNIFDQEKAELTSVASVREGQDETGTKKFTGPTVMAYRRAVDVLADKSAAEFQLLSVPGQRASQVTDYAIDACEDRFDALLVMDVIEKTSETHHVELSSEKPHVRNTISSFEGRSLDTSFAAAYFPDVVIRRPSDSAPVIMPPSVGMMGVMSRNDSIADPWFAPAGLSRGRLGAIDAQVQMNRDLLDELYDADINPIYVPAGRSGEVYAFGQKTLLQDASALDRINVRRLLIDIRRKVKKVGEELLFEPNRASTLTKFSALVEPIMANVQQRRGVERYKVQIDTTTTTQNDVENNTIRGKIYLQPTKSVEFISLDFVVANNIQ